MSRYRHDAGRTKMVLQLTADGAKRLERKMMNPTIILNAPERIEDVRARAGGYWNDGVRQRAEANLNLLARVVLLGGLGSVQASMVSVGTVALLADACPRAAKASQCMWEPVLTH